VAGSVNRVILIGHLGKDPEIKYTQSGKALTRFSLATSDRRKDDQGNWVDQTEWHNIVCFDKTAETAGEYLKKGAHIYLEGKIRTRSWDDKETGQKKYMTEIAADRFQFLDSKADRGQGGSPVPPSGGTTSSYSPPPPPPEPRMDGEEDLPF
jgi:single-strand DNA-binding protein